MNVSIGARISGAARNERRLRLLVALCFSIVGACAGPGAPRAAPDRDLEHDPERDLQQRLRASREDDRLLLVVFDSRDCVPCQRMEAETWFDPRVARRILELEIDARRYGIESVPDAARALDVVAVPQVVAWRRGVEVDRVRGYVGPVEFAAWLGTLERGGVRLDDLRTQVRARPDDGAALHAFAVEAARRGLCDEALDAFDRLWAMPPSARGEARARLAEDCADLVRRSPAAREPLLGRCDRLEALAAGSDDRASSGSGCEPDVRALPGDSGGGTARGDEARGDEARSEEARSDWIELAHALGEDARVLAWFDTLTPGDLRGPAVLNRREILWGALRAAARYDAIVRLVEASVPVTDYARARAAVPSFESAALADAVFLQTRADRARDLDDLRRGCLATGRVAEAAEIERIARDDGLK